MFVYSITEWNYSFIFLDILKEKSLTKTKCNQFKNDYDILQHLGFPIRTTIGGIHGIDQTLAIMDENDTFVQSLYMFEEKVVPSNIYCLSKLEELSIYRTPFENGNISVNNNIV